MLDPCPLPIQPWWQWHPPVGTYIGILGVLGVIVPWLFRPPEKMGRGEKALWTLLLFILFGLELRTLYLDRDEHDAQQAQARCQQLESFQKIADGINTAITTSQSQFNQTMLGLQTTIGGTQQAIKNTTPYADIQVDWMGGPIINGNPHTPISLVFGTPIAVNLFYHNAGLARADGVRVWFHFYVGKPDNLAAQRAIEKEFDKDWKAKSKSVEVPLAPGAQPVFSSFFQTFSDDDAKALHDGQTIYGMTRFEYRDRTGHWYFDDCNGFQEPLHDLQIAHSCLYLKNKRHLVAKS